MQPSPRAGIWWDSKEKAEREKDLTLDFSLYCIFSEKNRLGRRGECMAFSLVTLNVLSLNAVHLKSLSWKILLWDVQEKLWLLTELMPTLGSTSKWMGRLNKTVCRSSYHRY